MKVPPEDSEETCVGSRESKLGGMLAGDGSQARDTRIGMLPEALGSPSRSRPDTDSDPAQHNQARGKQADVLGEGRGHQMLVGGREAFLFPTGQVI